MKVVHHLIPILFLVSSLIRDTYGKPHVVSGPAHQLGVVLVPGEAPSVSGPHRIVVQVPGSHGMVDPVHAQHNVVVHRPVVHTIVVTASPPQQVVVPFNEFHQVVEPGPEVKVETPYAGWPEPETLRDREPKCSPSDNDVCSDVALHDGYMDGRFLIKTITIDQGRSCSCCGLCFQTPECFSLAFNRRTGECRLYGAVASYTTFTRDDDWKYSISGHSHKKSGHEQFCRRDHDCSAAGDACRGRICTNKKTVLCSTIYDVFMRGGASGKGLGNEIIATYGWIKGVEKRIACTLNQLSPGYTVLFRTRANFKFNDNTVRHYNPQLKDGMVPYSNLALAKRLRKLTKGGRYQLQLYSILQGSTEIHNLLQLSVPGRYPVIGTKPRRASTHNVKIQNLGRTKVSREIVGYVSLPYLARVNGPHQGHGKYNTQNGLLSLHTDGAGWGYLALARADGEVRLFGKHSECALLMRE